MTITYRQAREPMGLLKIEHIKAILKMPEVSERFRTAHGREWNQNDVAIAEILIFGIADLCLLHFRILRLLFREL